MIGAAVSCFSLLSMLMALPLGRLSDRLSARTLLLLSALFNLVYSSLLVLAQHIWVLIAAQMLGGLAFLLMIVSSQTWVSEHAEKAVREKGFGFLSLVAAVGQTIGPFLGGFLLSRTSFAAVFSLAVAFSLMGFAIAGLRPPVRSEKRGRTKARSGIKKALAGIAADRKMCAVLIFTFAAVFASNLRTSFVPVLFKMQGISESRIGLLLSAFALSMTLVRIFIGRLMGGSSRGSLLGVALVFIFTAVVALPSIAHVWAAAVAMLFFGTGFGISQPLSMVMVSDRAGGASGTAMGIRFFVITLGTLLSPVLTGLVVQGVSLAAGFYFVSGVLFIAAILIRLLGRR